MVHLDALLACVDYRDRRWELPVAVAPEVRRCLLAWQTSAPSVDAGVPVPVASLLASTLVEHALVSFPTIVGQRISFLHASRADDAHKAFDAGYFDWSQRSQVIFLSRRGAPPPIISEHHLRRAQEAGNMHQLSEIGLIGLLLPGVDGDVAGIYTFSEGLWTELMSGLRTACAAVDAQWRSVTESELRELLART